MSKTAQLLALAEAATPGPWWSGEHVPTNLYAGIKTAPMRISRTNNLLNARFIAAANPETIRQLVEQMNKLVAGLSDIRIARDDMEMWGIANDTLEAFNKWEGK